MSVLDRSALTESPLADLHAIASELSIDGYRRLRRPALIDAILAKQTGEPVPVEEAAADEAPAPAPAPAPASARPRSRRSRKPEAAEADEPPTADAADAADTADVAETVETVETVESVETAETAETVDALDTAEKADDVPDDEDEGAGARRRRGRRGGRGRSSASRSEPAVESNGDQGDDEPPPRASRRSREAAEPAPEPVADDRPEGSEQLVEGVVELLANGSGFVRVDPPDPSDDDVYISSAQVKRCELVSGDRVAGPKRAPRRSERFASLIRIETINDRPASELADSLRFEDLPAAMPSERIKVGSEDPTLKAIEWLTPFGKGSRVAIVGASRSGKSEALRRLAAALADRDELTLTVALAGVRPEEISEWTVAPAAAVSFAASEEAQNSAIEPVIDQARRLAARGADAIVLIDTLDGASRQMARKVMASARNIVDGGSLTVIATASQPIGGETTVISLDVALASIGRFPALDLVASGSLRPELLVGEAGAEAIARTRAEVSEADAED